MDTRKVAELRPHPKNTEIYGDAADDGLVDSVRQKGILVALLVTPDGRIISGHRRWDAAKRAGLAEVPVTVFASADELDILEALIHANWQRTKTNEQIGREYRLMCWCIQERRNSGPSLSASSQRCDEADKEGSKQKPGKIAAEKLGVAQRTVGKAAAVVERIDALKEEGEVEEAQRLRSILNERGAAPAHEEAGLSKPRTRLILDLHCPCCGKDISKWAEQLYEERERQLRG